jgi:hypothetical protein
VTAKAFVSFEEMFTPIRVSLFFASEIIPEIVNLSCAKLVVKANRKKYKVRIFFVVIAFIFSILRVTNLTN